MAGLPALAAPISCAGTVLSQPPISTTASIGWARIISSVSMAIRLRNFMELGASVDSCSEMVGNSSASPPAAVTPRLIASSSSGKWRWQGLNLECVKAMPTTGRASSSPE